MTIALGCGRTGFDELLFVEGEVIDAGIGPDADLGLSLAGDLVQCPLRATPTTDGTEVVFAFTAFRPGSTEADVRLARLSATGDVVSPPRVVATATGEVEAVEVFEDPTTGDTMLFYQSAGTIRLVRVDAAGTSMVDTEVATDVLSPAAAQSSAGYLVVWEDLGRQLQSIPVSSAGVVGAQIQHSASGRLPTVVGIGSDFLSAHYNGITLNQTLIRHDPDGTSNDSLALGGGFPVLRLAYDPTAQRVLLSQVLFQNTPGTIDLMDFDVSAPLASPGGTGAVSPDNRRQVLGHAIAPRAGGGFLLARRSDAFQASAVVAATAIPNLAGDPPPLQAVASPGTEVSCVEVVSTAVGDLIFWLEGSSDTLILRVEALAI